MPRARRKRTVEALPHLSLCMRPDDVDALRAALEVLKDKVLPQMLAHADHGSSCGIYTRVRELGVEAAAACLDWLQDGYEEVITEYAEMTDEDTTSLMDRITKMNAPDPSDILANRRGPKVMVMGSDGRGGVPPSRDRVKAGKKGYDA